MEIYKQVDFAENNNSKRVGRKSRTEKQHRKDDPNNRRTATGGGRRIHISRIEIKVTKEKETKGVVPMRT